MAGRNGICQLGKPVERVLSAIFPVAVETGECFRQGYRGGTGKVTSELQPGFASWQKTIEFQIKLVNQITMTSLLSRDGL